MERLRLDQAQRNLLARARARQDLAAVRESDRIAHHLQGKSTADKTSAPNLAEASPVPREPFPLPFGASRAGAHLIVTEATG